MKEFYSLKLRQCEQRIRELEATNEVLQKKISKTCTFATSSDDKVTTPPSTDRHKHECIRKDLSLRRISVLESQLGYLEAALAAESQQPDDIEERCTLKRAECHCSLNEVKEQITRVEDFSIDSCIPLELRSSNSVHKDLGQIEWKKKSIGLDDVGKRYRGMSYRSIDGESENPKNVFLRERMMSNVSFDTPTEINGLVSIFNGIPAMSTDRKGRTGESCDRTLLPGISAVEIEEENTFLRSSIESICRELDTISADKCETEDLLAAALTELSRFKLDAETAYNTLLDQIEAQNADFRADLEGVDADQDLVTEGFDPSKGSHTRQHGMIGSVSDKNSIPNFSARKTSDRSDIETLHCAPASVFLHNFVHEDGSVVLNGSVHRDESCVVPTNKNGKDNNVRLECRARPKILISPIMVK